MKIRWSHKSIKQLGSIRNSIAKDSPTRALKFCDNLKKKVEILTVFPNMGRKGDNVGTREFVVHKNYIVVYEVSGKFIDILSIFHVATNKEKFSS